MPIVLRLGRMAAACCLLWTLCGSASAEKVVLLPAHDGTLIESPTGALADGAAEHIRAGRTNQMANSIRRGLLAFAVAAAIPPGSVVTGATLILEMSATSAGPVTVRTHRVLTAWGEGTSASSGGQGAPATKGDATWIHRLYDSVFWQSPGGDIDPAESASATVGAVGLYTWQGPGLIADVQLWLDEPGTNKGWMLVGDERSPQTVKRFGAREVRAPGLPPVLVVEYASPTRGD
jgi:hypothetical protein